MSDFIEDLYYGNINPQDRGVKDGSELQRQMGLLIQKEELLTERLSEEERRLFFEYVKISGEVNGLSNQDSFTLGFKLGARFVYDTFVNGETPFTEPLDG